MAALSSLFFGERTASDEQRRQLEALLDKLLREAREAWPDVSVSAETFVPYLARRIGEEDDPAAVLAVLRVSDLYLACACAGGDDCGLAAFERSYSSEVDGAAARLRASAAVADEAKQIVREILFVARPDRDPAITTYSGRGDMRAWVRVTAMREVLRLVQSPHKQREFEDDALYDVLAPADSPELQHLKGLYRAEFVAAFRTAIGALEPKQRTLLRQQCIDGLSIDDLGTLYGVHRATTARWIARARETLLERTRKELMQKLGLGASDVESILRLVQSRMDLSLDGLLVRGD